jgi:coenzyme PQQ precursor peptide PqqA
MVRRLCGGALRRDYQPWDESIPARTVRCPCSQPFLQGEPSMTWQTPAATDLRFGFEITMYVSAR